MSTPMYGAPANRRPCDWGVKNGIAYSNDVGQLVVSNTDYISVIFPQGFADRDIGDQADRSRRDPGGHPSTNLPMGRVEAAIIPTVETFLPERDSCPFWHVPCAARTQVRRRLFHLSTHHAFAVGSGARRNELYRGDRLFRLLRRRKMVHRCGKDSGSSFRHQDSELYAFDFVGAQPGRWRVWAAGSGKLEGLKSGWCEFRYTK